MSRQNDRIVRPGWIQAFLPRFSIRPLGDADDADRCHFQFVQCLLHRLNLPLATVDEQNVGSLDFAIPYASVTPGGRLGQGSGDPLAGLRQLRSDPGP